MSHTELAVAFVHRIALTRSTAVAALSAMLLAVAGTATASVLLQTDSTWNVTPVAPTGDWNTDAGFDDSTWQNATVLYDVGEVTSDPAFNGTKGIWSSGGQSSTTETQIWIRRTFTLAGALSAASLIMGCDDDCTVYVNGTQVINDTSGLADNHVADLLPYLSVGTNLIAYTISDNFQDFGYNHSTWLQLDGELQSASVPEPGTLALLGLLLTGLAASRRRQR